MLLLKKRLGYANLQKHFVSIFNHKPTFPKIQTKLSRLSHPNSVDYPIKKKLLQIN